MVAFREERELLLQVNEVVCVLEVSGKVLFNGTFIRVRYFRGRVPNFINLFQQISCEKALISLI